MDRSTTLLLLILWPTTLLADVVVLHTGERLHGEIVSESNESVSLRCVNPKGNIHYVQRIKRSQIASIIRTDQAPATQPPAISPKRATATRPVDKELSFAEKQDLLAEAIRSWKHRNHKAAYVRLARLVRFTNDTEWARLSPTVEEQLEMTLADFAAEAQLQTAIESADGRPIDLGRVHLAVVPAMIPRLELAYGDALHQPVMQKSRSRKPTSRPADAAHAQTIADWIDKPADFEGNRPEAQAMMRQVRFAQSLLTERLRIEPKTAKNASARAECGRELDRLDALLTALSPRRPAPRLTTDTRPAKLPADETLEEQRRQWLEQRQKAEIEHIAIEGEKQETELLPE